VDLSRLNIFETGTNGAGLITSGGLDLTDSSTATSQNLADYTVDDFTTFIQNSATTRANNGAEMSRLEASYAMLTTNHGNIEAARSRLLDVDIATESTHYARHNILVQSSAAMLAQANSVPNIALQLLG
jgi:flagellin